MARPLFVYRVPEQLRGYLRHFQGSVCVQVCAADAMPFYKAEAKKRQATSTGGTRPQLRQKVVEADKGKATEKVAKEFDTNRQYVADVEIIKRKAKAERKKTQGTRTDLTSVKKFTEVNRATKDAAKEFDTNQQYVADVEIIKRKPPATQKVVEPDKGEATEKVANAKARRSRSRP